MKPLQYIKVIGVVFVLAACQRPGPDTTARSEDTSRLKVFLGIRSLQAKYQLPKEVGAYYPVVFFFHEGQLVETAKGPAMISVEGDNHLPVNVQLELMWQVTDGTFRRASLVDGLNELELSRRFKYWDKIRGYSMRQVRPEEKIFFEGAKILGLVASSEEKQPSLYPREIAESGTYVIAVGVVTGESRQEIEGQFLKQ